MQHRDFPYFDKIEMARTGYREGSGERKEYDVGDIELNFLFRIRFVCGMLVGPEDRTRLTSRGALI